MTCNWRRNAKKFVTRMNTNPSYRSTVTIFKEWDDNTREGIMNTSLRENGEGFDLIIKYVKEDKILAFYNIEEYRINPAKAERIKPWKLIQELMKTKKSPEVTPHIPPAIQKLRELVKNEPCPNINLTPMEKDVLIFGIFYNPENEEGEPWGKGAVTIRVNSTSVLENSRTIKKKVIPTVMASLTKKGLIRCFGVYGSKKNPRICEVTKAGTLVLRREITGA